MNDLHHVSQGEAGEVFIGGAGVARGIVIVPISPPKRFVINPFSQDSEDRLYRTGDLGRFLPDGQFGFLGREDEQIKISGYRIEPEQIVQAIVAHPSVEAAAVVARQDANSAKNWSPILFRSADSNLSTFGAPRISRTAAAFVHGPCDFCSTRKSADYRKRQNGSLGIARAQLLECPSGTACQPMAKSPVEERLARILGRLLGTGCCRDAR